MMAPRMKTILVNDTPFEIKLSYYERQEFSSVISAGGKYFLFFDPFASYRSFELRSSLDNFMSALDIDISPDDFLDLEEMRVIYRSPENVFSVGRIPRGGRSPDVSFSRPTFTKCTAGIVIVKIRLQASHLVAHSCQDFKATRVSELTGFAFV